MSRKIEAGMAKVTNVLVAPASLLAFEITRNVRLEPLSLPKPSKNRVYVGIYLTVDSQYPLIIHRIIITA